MSLTVVMFRCEGCGECCRELFGKKFGAALLPAETAYLQNQAASLGVSVNFLPLTKNLAGQITTYQWTDKKCPFLNASNSCMIYRVRPSLCRAFPCMPYGVGYCHRIARDQLHRTPHFSPAQIAEGKMYMQNVAELIKQAIWVYHIDKSRWELNKI
jgi:Fe-S-cluster containining protein